MSHKKNDLSYSEGGNSNAIDRQSSNSSISSNPWGVQLNRLSFKNQTASKSLISSPKTASNIISNNKKNNKKNNHSKNNNSIDTQRPQRPKTLKQRTSSSKHNYESSETIPGPAFSSKEDSKNDDSKNKNINTEKVAKKRKLRRQLSLAKMQMSVLKARLGLEQMKTPQPNTPNIIEENKQDEQQQHSRSISVSTENLFAAVDYYQHFEQDIKDAIEKVDHIVNNNKQNDEKLIEENIKLKKEINELKEKLKKLESVKKKETQKVIKQEIKEEYKPDPLEKYTKMKDLGMSIDKIVQKMEKANINSSQIEKWKKKVSSQSADQILASKVNAKEQLYAKYDKMRKINMPQVSIRNKMKMDGFKDTEIDKYLNFGNNNNDDEKMKKYSKMKKMGMPEHVIRNKMKLDGINIDEQDTFFGVKKEKEKEKEKDTQLAKYERMRKMGMPTHAIVNKMRLDGISADKISIFESPNNNNNNNKKKQTQKASDPRLSKYERMKKMGMPMHAIVNKMRLDGIEQSLIHKIEHPMDNDDEEEDEEEEEEEEEEDPNKANDINLNIPALSKYNRMKKMGMPPHAIVNKMKLDGIDQNLIDAFENKKKKKKKFGFHKRKTSIPPKEKIKPNVDMKRFHWQTVDYKAAKNSIWKTMNEKSVMENLNIVEFEGLFSIPKKENKLKKLFGSDKKKEEEKKKEEIKFVSAKRQYNVELLLKRLKLSGSELCKNIIEMNEEKLTLELLIKISDMVPNDEEQMQAIGMSNKHNKKTLLKYGIVEAFFYDLSSIWSLQERIKLWIFKKEFIEIYQYQLDKISLLNKGLSDIQGSESLNEVLKIILAFGNYMNGGRRNGQAYGFTLETLRMLSGTKGTDQQTTLLMYIYRYTKQQQQQQNIKINIVKELENVSNAVRIDIEALDKKIKEIENEIKKLPKRLKEFEKQTKKIKNDCYYKNMLTWMEKAKNLLNELKREFGEMFDRAVMLAETFAFKLEKKNITSVNDFLKIFNDFVKDWHKAKIKYTKLEEKKKKDALRAKKKEEAQKKLQLKLSKRTATRQQLAKKNILKDKEKVKQEQMLKEKLKKTMKAHVRKQTVMKQMFGDVLNQSDEEEEEEEEEQEQEEEKDNSNFQYKNYINSYQQKPNANNIVHFSPDVDNNNNNNNNDVDNNEPEISNNKGKSTTKKKNKHKNKGIKKQDSNHSGLFQKRKAVPTASQFGNVWELNFSPMSRMAYSNSKNSKSKKGTNATMNKKKKKVKYKSGHVRRETRLKKAFESMANADLSGLNIDAPTNENKKKNKSAVSVASPKSKGGAMYSKYRNKTKKKATNKVAHSVVEF